MIAAIYARRTNDQSERDAQDKSVVRQVERARAFAEQRGWIVDDAYVFVDDGIRGSEFAKRQDYNRLLRALRPRPPFDVLIVSELSRLGREQFETGYAAKQLATAGVKIFSYLEGKEAALDTPTDKFMLAAVNYASELERDKGRQRVTDAMSRKAAKGHACGGDCFGYRNVEVFNSHGKRSHVDRVIDESEAAIVRRIFSMCAAGIGHKGIAKALNAERLPAPRPKRERVRGWTPSTVRTVLFRDLYRGVSIWNKRRQTDSWGQRIMRKRAESEWIRAEVPHLRIVTDEQWDATHRRLSVARVIYQRATHGEMWGRPPSSQQSKYLLSGLMQCACCGGSMIVRSGAHGLGQRYSYICATYNNRGASICDNGLRLPIEIADDSVLHNLAYRILAPAVVDGAINHALAELRPTKKAIEERRKQLREQILRTEEEQAKLVAAISVAGEVEALARAIREREAERSNLRSELARLDTAERLGGAELKTLERDLRGRLEEWRDLLGRQTAAARPIVQELLDGRIVWKPRKNERIYEYSGRVRLDGAFTGIADTLGMVPVRGFEPRLHG